MVLVMMVRRKVETLFYLCGKKESIPLQIGYLFTNDFNLNNSLQVFSLCVMKEWVAFCTSEGFVKL